MVDYSMSKIAILDSLVAQRIAAGEVIERPASVVRELLDNALDSGATEISVILVDGGTSRITVIDNGSGIASDELALVCQSHATSKVSTLEDLYNLTSMGFRGEALYSIAAAAKVTIASKKEGDEATTIVVDNSSVGKISPGGPLKGTRVDVEDLFMYVPARKMFLKRNSTEYTMCKNVFIEKALAFPDISFKLYDENRLTLSFEPSSLQQRVISSLSTDKRVTPTDMIEISDEGARFSFVAITTSGASYRNDRSHIRVYVNKRAIDEYALVQAASYGYKELLPGGAFPYSYLFITVDPELVDFNIHPAKREAKIRNLAEIHHSVTSTLRKQLPQQLAHVSLKSPSSSPQQELYYTPKGTSTYDTLFSPAPRTYNRPSDDSWFERAKEVLQQKQEEPHTRSSYNFHYIGQLFTLFLLVEKDDSLYLIDQHAAHERLLYDQIRSDKGVQHLMLPIEFEVEYSIDQFLLHNSEKYATYGLTLKKKGDLRWELTTIPSLWKSIEKDVIAFITSFSATDPQELEKRLYSTIACRAAVKAGDAVDMYTAEALIQQVFDLENPVCPHGRVFVIEITKEQLYQSVGRII